MYEFDIHIYLFVTLPNRLCRAKRSISLHAKVRCLELFRFDILELLASIVACSTVSVVFWARGHILNEFPGFGEFLPSIWGNDISHKVIAYFQV